MATITLKTRRTPPRVRGYLRRFLTEVDRNLFVGSASSRVVESMWEKITSNDYIEGFEDYTATLILFIKSGFEQDFIVREFNPNKKFRLVEKDGILLSEKKLTEDSHVN